MRISDCSSDVCSSDLRQGKQQGGAGDERVPAKGGRIVPLSARSQGVGRGEAKQEEDRQAELVQRATGVQALIGQGVERSEERRAGEEGGSTWRYRGSADHKKKKTDEENVEKGK